MFKQIRTAHPNIPIIMMAAPHFLPNETFQTRSKIIDQTYKNAIENGDKNVYFIDGPTLMQYAKNEGTVDNCHPTDLGFASMAKTLSSILENII